MECRAPSLKSRQHNTGRFPAPAICTRALLIIAREIDLSVASMLALSSVVFGVAVQAGAPISLAILAALLTGLVGGALNGALVTMLGLPSLDRDARLRSPCFAASATSSSGLAR